ncbi:hypothetical protein [Reichenbachiella ulvae]|uniref:Uncharacterized protein n=1 Tax=Reichenbachiella ulvae TaxID=2980104 RepID=A0ABT3CQD0_9BACT|nr:hypothetical protein [Reichenbachiella ulvae]MCV9385931.1 hypothetical protein [Reichenbachiella ulvae]
MFDGSDYPKSLSEEVFEEWLEQGRESKLSYAYLLIVWDAFEEKYLPEYTEDRQAINRYERYQGSTGRESLVAVYDLYSESKIHIYQE